MCEEASVGAGVGIGFGISWFRWVVTFYENVEAHPLTGKFKSKLTGSGGVTLLDSIRGGLFISGF